jgi:predicted transcriptional regulator
MAKRFSSYRLSEECHELLGKLANKLGLTRTTVIEMAVRKLAEQEAVSSQPQTGTEPEKQRRSPKTK